MATSNETRVRVDALSNISPMLLSIKGLCGILLVCLSLKKLVFSKMASISFFVRSEIVNKCFIIVRNRIQNPVARSQNKNKTTCKVFLLDSEFWLLNSFIDN